MHFVITGASGFIGASVVAELLARGSKVTVLLRSNSDRTRLIGLSGFTELTYSALLSKETISCLSEKKPDIFIHCAWHGVGGHDRNEAFQVLHNIPFTLDTVELAASVGCRQWIGLGSQAEYGSHNCRINEDVPLKPTTVYGKAKLAAGIAALGLCDARNMAGVWLRIFSIYGPGDAPHYFIPYVIQQFLAGNPPRLTQCEQLWDDLYVTDAARAIVATATGTLSGVFNLGSGCSRPLKDYVETIRNELGISIEPDYGALPYRPDQVMHLEADITRLTDAIDWLPETPLIEGLRKTIDFARCNASGVRTS